MKKKLLLFFVVFIFIIYFESCLGCEFENKKVEINFEDLSLEEKTFFLEREILKYEDHEIARMIDLYYAKWNLPLSGKGYLFVKEARKNNIFPLLLPAIGMAESTGGKKQFRKNNPFGFGTRNFSSKKEAIFYVSYVLGGEHPDLAFAYQGKNTYEKIMAYNFPYREEYIPKIVMIMKEIIDNYNNFS